MSKLFPHMTSKPEKVHTFALIFSWIFFFVLFPTFLPYLGFGLWEQGESSVWLEIGYHAVTGVGVLFLILGYLKEEWFMLTTDVWHCLKHVLLTVGLILGVEAIWLGVLYLGGFDLSLMMESLPVAEMNVSHTSLSLVQFQPILGTIVLSVFAPISICALFYCTGFSPLCNIKPWLGYLGVVVVTLVPPIIDILWRGDAALVLYGYLATLPIHLLACWSYQKTDNVWTPLFSLAGANLLISGLLQIFLHFVF